jgi:hypothetical protein
MLSTGQATNDVDAPRPRAYALSRTSQHSSNNPPQERATFDHAAQTFFLHVTSLSFTLYPLTTPGIMWDDEDNNPYAGFSRRDSGSAVPGSPGGQSNCARSA